MPPPGDDELDWTGVTAPQSVPRLKVIILTDCSRSALKTKTLLGSNATSVSNEAPAGHLRDAQSLQQLGLRHAVAHAHLVYNTLYINAHSYLACGTAEYVPAYLPTCVPDYSRTCLLTNLLAAHLDALYRLDVIRQLLVLSHPLILPPAEANSGVVPRWIGLLVRVVPGKGV